MFLSRNKKNNVYPCKPRFTIKKVGLRGSKLYRRVFVMSAARFSWYNLSNDYLKSPSKQFPDNTDNDKFCTDISFIHSDAYEYRLNKRYQRKHKNFEKIRFLSLSTLSADEYIYSRLSLSRIPRDSLKYFEISVPRHIMVERVRKTIN